MFRKESGILRKTKQLELLEMLKRDNPLQINKHRVNIPNQLPSRPLSGMESKVGRMLHSNTNRDKPAWSVSKSSDMRSETKLKNFGDRWS